MEASASADRRQTSHHIRLKAACIGVEYGNGDEGGGRSRAAPADACGSPGARRAPGEACYSCTVTVTSSGVVLTESSA